MRKERQTPALHKYFSLIASYIPLLKIPTCKNMSLLDSGNISLPHIRYMRKPVTWVRKMPWRRNWQLTPVFLPEKFPWTEEPGGLQSTGSQRIGHELVTNIHTEG